MGSPKLPLDVTSMPTNYLEGMPKKYLSCHFTINMSTWSSLNATGTLTGTMLYGQMKLKLSFSATNTQGRFVLKKKIANTKNNLHVSMVDVEVP